MTLVRKCSDLQIFWKSRHNTLRIRSIANKNLFVCLFSPFPPLPPITFVPSLAPEIFPLGSYALLYIRMYLLFAGKYWTTFNSKYTYILFIYLFVYSFIHLFNHLLLPSNSLYLSCFLHVWSDLKQSQGKFWMKLVSFLYR